MYPQLGVVFITLFQIVITEKCVTPNNEEAKCVSIYSCKILLDALKTKQNESIEFVRKSVCEGRESDRMVCCGSTSRFSTPVVNKYAEKDKLLPNRAFCGYQHSDDYFRGEGETVIVIYEFPWMAGLLYKDDNKTAVGCSGSLISNRYVLTAAHCIITGNGEVPVLVLLGEYSIKTAEECTEDTGFQDCSDPPQHIGIEKIIAHPQFDKRNYVHDIGLLRLSKTVEYSDYIRPICLPTAGTTFAELEDKLLTSGWGLKQIHGELTPIKKRISSKIITNEECERSNTSYEKVLNENHVCTKELENNTEVICSGDVGAPVMFSFKNQWHQEGVVSSFFVSCDHGYPNVYTKVVNYLDWIRENIEP